MQKYIVFLTFGLMSSTAFATINAFPTSVNFFSVSIGMFQSQTVTVQNINGPAEQVSVSNSCFGDFMVNNMCNLTLSPNGSCSSPFNFSRAAKVIRAVRFSLVACMAAEQASASPAKESGKLEKVGPAIRRF